MRENNNPKGSQPGLAKMPDQKIHYPFWFGGSASCCAAAVTHPLDLGMCPVLSHSFPLFYDLLTDVLMM